MALDSKQKTTDTGAVKSLDAAVVVPQRSALQVATKRAMDIALTLLAMPLVLPLGLLIGIMIKLDSNGPIFYTQKRVGKGEKLFTLYKFRSMKDGANALKNQLKDKNEAAGPVFKIKKDPRITRVGAILRKSSLDELPQLINIIKGEMSIVGPRPPLPEEVEKYNDYQRGRLAVKPGLTCLWQIQGRSSIGFDQWVELDLEYIRIQSIWVDIKIICKTIPAVLKCTGAW